MVRVLSPQPGDLVRPKKSYKATVWYDVVRDESGAVQMMHDIVKGRRRYLKSAAIIVAVDAGNNEALLLWSNDHNRLVWTWRNQVVLLKR